MTTLISVLIIVLIAWACFWLIDNVGIGAPFVTILKAIVAIIAIAEMLHYLALW